MRRPPPGGLAPEVENESLFRRIVEAAPDAVVVADETGAIVLVNGQTEKTFGYVREELLGHPVSELMPERFRSRHLGYHTRFVADPRTRPMDAAHSLYGLRKNGEEFPVEISLSPLETETGLLVVSSIRDITERTRLERLLRERTAELDRIKLQEAESALRHERNQVRQYLDTAAVILLVLDLNGHVTRANRYACSFLGWTEDELIGRDWFETCLPERTRDAMRKTFDGLLDGDLSVVENPVLVRSGEERLVEWRITGIRDDVGQMVGTLNSGTDVTERQHALGALRTAEERMRFALDAANVGVWDLDLTTGALQLQWSDILEAQHGLSPGGFAGTLKSFVAHVHPGDRRAVLEAMARSDRAGADFSVEYRALWADGTVRWLKAAGRIHFGEHGERARCVGISLDLTERRALEAQYQQAQKMEAVGRLAGGVAHDFNNLLTAILGYSELLLADLDRSDSRYGDIAEIQKAGTRASGLTRQLLTFSRKQVVQPTLLDLNVVVAGMQEMLERLIGEDIRIVLRLWPERTTIEADRGQIEQVVMNLALNARDAMPTGGTLTIETANVELDDDQAARHALTAGLHVMLAVTDTGTGITAEALAHMFEPFFTTKEPDKGTGLGLATVHGIVTRSGGNVDVRSEAGNGTAFTVYLPRADAVKRVAEPPPPPAARRRTEGQTVLVVDDAEGIRNLTRRLLERQGYRVLLAADAGEAHRLFEQHPSIDLLLTDVVMPGTSGPQLVRQLVERRPALKVVYMSGYTDDAIIRHGLLDPANALLHKPFTAATLGPRVRDALDGGL